MFVREAEEGPGDPLTSERREREKGNEDEHQFFRNAAVGTIGLLFSLVLSSMYVFSMCQWCFQHHPLCLSHECLVSGLWKIEAGGSGNNVT